VNTVPLNSVLLNEIYEQPEAIRHMLEVESERVASISQQLSPRTVSSALVAARGTGNISSGRSTGYK
jgi:fructoselysine-6-P-deglycase FrlB-like protein